MISRVLTKAGYLLIAVGWYLCASGSAKESPELSKLTEGAYARIVNPEGNAVGNAGFVVLERSVLVFDTHFTPEAGQVLLSDIRAVTPKAIRYVVNSHAHADHTHGNQVFPEAQLIAGTNARRDVLQVDLPSLNRTTKVAEKQLEKLRQDAGKEKDPDLLARIREQIKLREDSLQTMSRLKIMVPVIALDDSLTIRDGKQEACVSYIGVGHTTGDVVLFLPSQKIAYAGDLFFNAAIPYVQDASILQWMKTLEVLLKLDAEKFVPGHGPVGTKKDVESFLAYFEELKALVQPVVDRGDSVDQAVKEIAIPAKYASYRSQHLFPSNIQKMYAELRSQQIAIKPPEGGSKKEAAKPLK